MKEVFDRRTYHLQIEEAAFTDVPASWETAIQRKSRTFMRRMGCVKS